LLVYLPMETLIPVTRTSVFTGKTRTFYFAVTQEQLDGYYNYGLLLQDAFPNLQPWEREFIKTGVTDEEWSAAFGE
jgi:hypothetical protein